MLISIVFLSRVLGLKCGGENVYGWNEFNGLRILFLYICGGMQGETS